MLLAQSTAPIAGARREEAGMPDEPRRDPGDRDLGAPVPPRGVLTSDIPEEWRAGRYVTLTVGGGVNMAETHPTDANPEARG
jgi:hypothetical protein